MFQAGAPLVSVSFSKVGGTSSAFFVGAQFTLCKCLGAVDFVFNLKEFVQALSSFIPD